MCIRDSSITSLPGDMLQHVVSSASDPRVICSIRLVCRSCCCSIDSFPNVWISLLSQQCRDFFHPSMIDHAKATFQQWYRYHTEWIEHPPDTELPPRFLHRAARVDHSVYIFGGRSAEGSTNELWRMDLPSKALCQVPIGPSHACPSPRSSVSLTPFEQSLYVFGGLTHDDVYCNELWLFDINTAEWSEVIPPVDAAWPLGRWGHTMTSISDGQGSELMVLFGGSAPGRCFDDVWVLDPSSHSWSTIEPADDAAAFTLSAAINIAAAELFGTRSSDSWPAARAGHSATVVGENILVFGGNTTVECFDDLWVLPVVSIFRNEATWTRIAYTGDAPSARIGHSAHVVGDRLYVIGGRNNIHPTKGADRESIYVLESGSWQWHEAAVSGDEEGVRAARTGHSVVAYPPVGLICVGGMQIKRPTTLLSDLLVLRVLN
eukprot:TRINITY_DN16249_c0_g1_i3.p1 TRINITY_DN16249_c0_g1~~TRINITY_DN16249_c0_g1_i3.p1  ORF type:complete len:433 (-),score=65.90 TRINITY_DN16249_c0_g1_i3:115-1413(-)